MGTLSEAPWFGRRFNALLVEFPSQLTPESLPVSPDHRWDAEDAYDGLLSAHRFLVGVSSELLRPGGGGEHDEQVLSKLNLIWLVSCLSRVVRIDNVYCLDFPKESLMRYKTNKIAPKSFPAAFESLSGNGVRVDFRVSRASSKKQSFGTCDSGTISFDDRCTALGLKLFADRLMEKRWYWEEDKAGNYSTGPIQPIIHCIEPFYRADMRVFLVEDRLRFDFWEQFAGYSDGLKALVRRIDDHVKGHYGEYLPSQGFYRYIFSTVSYNRGFSKRLLLSLGVGHNEDAIGYYSTLSGKEVEKLLEILDSLSPRITGCFLHPSDCPCPACAVRPNPVVYRGGTYNNPNKSYEFRFPIDCGDAVDDVIVLMDIKAGSELRKASAKSIG